MLKTSVLVPCYRRPEYTDMCLRALEGAQNYEDTIFHLYDDGSNDGTDVLLKEARLPKEVHVSKDNNGLRHVLLDFICERSAGAEFITVVGNDCLMPKKWLKDILATFERTDVDILSPNVEPSNAAYRWGQEDTKGLGYRPAQTVGGLWTMRRALTDGVYFERVGMRGILGAFQVLRQIIVEKNPKVGWTTDVTVQDVGHWSGQHDKHIKSPEHKVYSAEIGRPVAW